ncbi:MAG: SUF system NifU family Fe-S cluster assembly protein [Thaumarchaeota archaeon]|nr:SUF system NifU family Fe-S cluster assembly protein [Candidatus Calditenuaceae archaeon]MDW8186574.1 SUF system NifU family Fe-S cluster assembly protein [Nitrososphaerota archaeon]
MEYSETIDEILDHYRNPRNYGELADATVRAKDSNPLCGDVIEMFLKVDGGKIVDVRFRGKGCAISQASASMLTERLKGMTLEEARSLDRNYVLDMLGVNLSPVRVKCATLSLKVMKVGVYSYLGSSVKDLEV